MIDVLEKSAYAITDTFDKDKIGVMEEDGVEVIDPHFGLFDIDLKKQLKILQIN